MIFRTVITIVTILSLFSCSRKQKSTGEVKTSELSLKVKIETLNNALIAAAMARDFTKAEHLYSENIILLAEYMPIVESKAGIQKYFTEIFKRQNLKIFEKETSEIFDFGETIIEIGVFKKSFENTKNQTGQYWNIWKLQEDGTLLLSAETYGLFFPLENPSTLVVDSIPGTVWNSLQVRKGVKIPLEFDAYSALMENIVRDRDTEKILELYTEDGSYTPFVDTTKAGKENLTKHFYAYHKNPVVIDSIESSTYDFILVPNGVIRFTQFYVEWTVPGFSGKNQGSGIQYWKRQENNALRLHRQIGHHTYLPK